MLKIQFLSIVQLVWKLSVIVMDWKEDVNMILRVVLLLPCQLIVEVRCELKIQSMNNSREINSHKRGRLNFHHNQEKD